MWCMSDAPLEQVWDILAQGADSKDIWLLDGNKLVISDTLARKNVVGPPTPPQKDFF